MYVCGPIRTFFESCVRIISIKISLLFIMPTHTIWLNTMFDRLISDNTLSHICMPFLSHETLSCFSAPNNRRRKQNFLFVIRPIHAPQRICEREEVLLSLARNLHTVFFLLLLMLAHFLGKGG